jgi:hypothetical protein
MNSVKILFAVIFLSGNPADSFAQSSNFQGIQFDFHKISDIRNGYKIQSNGTPQQLWMDLDYPDFLHAIFTNSQFPDPPWADRTCIYFGSTDFGTTWFQLGSVPDTSRSGFPSITGTSDGAAVITNHTDYFGSPVRTGLFIDQDIFHFNFSAYDIDSSIATSWPKCFSIPGNKILILANAQLIGLVMSIFDLTSGTFTGWTPFGSTNTQEYSLCVSDAGKIGFAYIGNDMIDDGDVFYFESTDNGIIWSSPLKIFDCPAENGIAVGALRGISLNFYGEEPCIVFEVCQQDFSLGGGYFPRLPNEILFWSPNINGGNPKVIADENNVPFYPSIGQIDIFPPLCRPVISRIQDYNNILLIAFNGSTENVYVGNDSVTYFAGYLSYSINGGETWSDPDKFTPESPLLDWKYISGLTILPLIEVSDEFQYKAVDIHFVMQSDSLEENPNPFFLSSQYYHASAEPFIYDIWPSVEDDILIFNFELEQNYPNPFNPITSIEYVVPGNEFISLKVYDVLGKEIAVLVNEEKPAGSYQVNFDANGIPSGVYFYKLKSGEFSKTKKMILMK